jgi:hypothetical protein
MRRFIPVYMILSALRHLHTGGLMVRVRAGLIVREFALAGVYPAALNYSKERFS